MINNASIYQDSVLVSLFKNKKTVFGFTLLLFLFSLAIFGPIFSKYTYFQTFLELQNLPPCPRFIFGTDELGRDIFTRTCTGARISLTVGILAALIDIVIGVIWGTIAGYFGGKVDEVMMRICDILYSIPYLLFIILLLVIMEPGLVSIIVALSLLGWINMSRIIRGQILQLKKQDFITAAKSFGASHKRIIFLHMIPNTLGPILVTLTFSIPVAIFSEAFLSFLGLGIQAPIASWGVMVNDALSALRYYPWRLFFPAFMICITMLSFNLLGDGLRDILDPRKKS